MDANKELITLSKAISVSVENDDSKYQEVFDTRFFSAMHCTESDAPVQEHRMYLENLKPDWVKEGVQIQDPESQNIRHSFKILNRKFNERSNEFTLPETLIKKKRQETPRSTYTSDLMDSNWINLVNEERQVLDLQLVDVDCFENLIVTFEKLTFEQLAIKQKELETQVLEFDENSNCNICGAYDGEDDNELVFCDGCYVCVHQACYGIAQLPEGSWLCKLCSSGAKSTTSCSLCPNSGGAMKLADDASTWCHVSCALWVPEVGFSDVELMEPITNLHKIPQARKNLLCTLCRSKTGAPIQCAIKKCSVAFHVTCAFQNKLVMETVLEGKDVRMKAYCPKHSQQLKKERSEEETPAEIISTNSPTKNIGLSISVRTIPPYSKERPCRIAELDSRFYECVDQSKVLSLFPGLTPSTFEVVFNYWKLKRRFNFNKPLILPIPLSWSSTSQLVDESPPLALFDLEKRKQVRITLDRARILVDMVAKREKKKRSLLKCMSKLVNVQCKLLKNETLPDGWESLSSFHLDDPASENENIFEQIDLVINSEATDRFLTGNPTIDQIPLDHLVIEKNKLEILHSVLSCIFATYPSKVAIDSSEYAEVPFKKQKLLQIQ
ncbi:Protein Jade-1 [Cichlidogyrus casuarinus]|uniref:Protein Jade-1 n=1 Tax=Cichlidogyrus casuarinus TaxID=1844966 RepID=A0ABD2PWB8_9PLAT